MEPEISYPIIYWIAWLIAAPFILGIGGYLLYAIVELLREAFKPKAPETEYERRERLRKEDAERNRRNQF